MNAVSELFSGVPQGFLPHLHSCVNRGYELAELFINNAPFMWVPSAAMSKQNLYNHAIDFTIEKAIESGNMQGSQICYENNVANNHMHSELRVDDILITVSSQNGGRKLTRPRPASFRERHANIGQLCMDENGDIDLAFGGYKYAILCHRCQRVRDELRPLVYIGIPDMNYDAWICADRIESVYTGIDIVEPIADNDDIAMEFNEEAIKRMKKNMKG